MYGGADEGYGATGAGYWEQAEGSQYLRTYVPVVPV